MAKTSQHSARKCDVLDGSSSVAWTPTCATDVASVKNVSMNLFVVVAKCKSRKVVSMKGAHPTNIDQITAGGAYQLSCSRDGRKGARGDLAVWVSPVWALSYGQVVRLHLEEGSDWIPWEGDEGGG